MKFSLIALAALAALPVAAAHAADGAFISGTQIVRVCGNQKMDAACTGFIGGALDQASASPALRNEICVPSGTKLGALRTALVRYAREHADQVSGSGVGLLNAMVKANYPCPGK